MAVQLRTPRVRHLSMGDMWRRRFGNNRSLPGSIRRSLLVSFFVLVLVALGAFLAAAWAVVYRPLSAELAAAEMQVSSQQVQAQLHALVRRVEAVARINHDWGERGLIEPERIADFNRLMRPVLEHGPDLSSVVVAHESGRELLLMRLAGQRFLNRLTDPQAQPGTARLLTWSDDGNLERAENIALDYDARRRPWFTAAMALERSDEVHWTEPFVFRSSQEPGLSAVVRFTAPDGRRYAMTSDIRLTDLSRLTAGITVGKRGMVAVLTIDGRLLGVPRDARFDSDASIRASVLKPAAALGIEPLSRAYAAWQDAGGRSAQLLRFSAGGEEWLGIFRSMRFGTQTFWVGTFAPRSDFEPGNAMHGLLLAGLVGLALLLGWFIAVRLSRRFSEPLERLEKESTRIGRLELEDPVQVRSPWRELNALARAQEAMRLALLAATRRLAQANETLEHKVEQRTQQLAEAKAAADAAREAKAVFLAHMSHELRTPVNAIVGLTRLAQKGELAPPQRERIAKIERAGRYLLGIIGDVLDSAKIEAGKLTLERREFSLRSLMDDLVALVGEGAAAKGLTLRVEIDPRLPERLVGDPLRLGQVLLNYASNAIKFTTTGSVLVQVTPLEEQAEELLVEFRVSDTGVGLSGEQIESLFTPFQQAEVSTTRRYGGTGLGLAISKRLAELMGGEVGVESVVGEGSSFRFTARLGRVRVAGQSQDAAEAKGAAPSWPGRRLLLAEDNPLNQEVALAILHEAGLEVDVAGTGEEALRLLEQRRYELVLMDVRMPVMDGLAATRRIREMPGLAALPVIAMTAGVLPGELRECEEAGMDDHVAKPIVPAQLWRTLARWMPASLPRTPPGADAAAAAATPDTPYDGIAGLDARAALDRLAGKRSLYESVLHAFVKEHPSDGVRVVEALRTGDRHRAAYLLHTLKGAAGSVGADEVVARAVALEAAIAAEEPYDRLAAMADALAAALERLIGALRERLGATWPAR